MIEMNLNELIECAFCKRKFNPSHGNQRHCSEYCMAKNQRKRANERHLKKIKNELD